MAFYRVKYMVNKAAGTGRLDMENKYGMVDTDADKNNDVEFRKVIKEALSQLERVPQNEIKIVSYSEE
ncbi:hypothetical protein [Paenibacillus spongiae]|uniref:DUF1659 domain-containing protein n=1 Tax=Paenibacillus spongiae TaxID=2909671 RepID=A0ABY5SH65_9BACL|nr:hypothetical protein [Paenibacillus spongiae]UVI32067.1 hypothetical protein L1F29_09720 [Paenibacillus spongiae]